MATKADKELVDRKRKAVAAKIKEIAPHADMMVGLLDETKLDMIAVALGCAIVELRE